MFFFFGLLELIMSFTATAAAIRRPFSSLKVRRLAWLLVVHWSRGEALLLCYARQRPGGGRHVPVAATGPKAGEEADHANDMSRGKNKLSRTTITVKTSPRRRNKEFSRL